MIASKEEMRNNLRPEYTSLDLVFESEINKAIKLTDENYSNMNFRAAVKTGFFDLQVKKFENSSSYINYMHCVGSHIL